MSGAPPSCRRRRARTTTWRTSTRARTKRSGYGSRTSRTRRRSKRCDDSRARTSRRGPIGTLEWSSGDARSTPSTAIERTDDDARRAQAFRKLALKKHPDKRPASEREAAEREFDALQKGARRARRRRRETRVGRCIARQGGERGGAREERRKETTCGGGFGGARARGFGGGSPRGGGGGEGATARRVGTVEETTRGGDACARGERGGCECDQGDQDARAEVPAHLYRAIKMVWRA